MKPIILLFFAMLGIASAQSSVPPAPTIPETGPERVDNTGLLHLMSGNLPFVVEEVRRAAPLLRDANGQSTTMPNVIFSPEADAAMVSADLQLRDVSAVQAIALVAAAAGCTTEPILAPKEAAASIQGEDKIIGYRISLAAPGPVPPGMLGIMNPASEPPTQNRFSTTAKDASKVKVVENPLATPAVQKGASAITLTAIEPNVAAVPVPTVRVYALGAVLRGDSDQIKEKQADLKTLVEEAMSHAGLPTESLTLSFHSGTKALIVKGSAAQHEIVGQVITAMKENVDSEAGGSTKQ